MLLGGNASLGIGLSITLVDRFSQRANAITTSMARMGQTSAQMKRNMTGALNGLQLSAGIMAGIGYGTWRFAKRSVSEFAKFEYMMKSVQAVAGKKNITAEHLASISKEAQNLAEEFGALPVDVAKGMFVLAKAGQDTEPKIKGIMRAVLQLSAAADEAPDKMAENIIGTLNTFQILTNTDSAAEISRKAQVVADMLAKSANLVSIGVNDAMESIKYSGNTAKALGIPLEELLAGITTMGSRNIKGSSAGIYIQQMLNDLNTAVSYAPKKKQLNALALMGISPRELVIASNNLRDFYGLGKLFSERTANMDKMTKAKTLADLAGIRGSRALLPLLEAHNEHLRYRNGILASTNSAQDVANDRLNSAAGAQKKWTAAVSNFRIAMGDAYKGVLMEALPVLTKFLKLVTAFAQTKMGKFFIVAATAGLMLVGVLGMILLPIATLGLLIVNARTGFQGMAAAGTWAFNAIGSSINSAIWKLRLYLGLMRGNPALGGMAQWPAGTMRNGRNVGGQMFNPAMYGMMAGGMGRGGRGAAGIFGAGTGLMRLMNASMILYAAFDVISNLVSGKLTTALGSLAGGIAGFFIGGPLGALIGSGLGSMLGGLFEGDGSPSVTRAQSDRDAYMRGRNANVSMKDSGTGLYDPTSPSAGMSSSNRYYYENVQGGRPVGVMNIHVDGKKELTRYMDGQNEDIYLGNSIQ